jgi:hypothetical protein
MDDHALLTISTGAAAVAAVMGFASVGVGYWTVQEAKAADRSNRLYQRLRALQEVAQARIGMDIGLSGGSGPMFAEHKGKLLVALAAFEPGELAACEALGAWTGTADTFGQVRDPATLENQAALVDTRAQLARLAERSWLRRIFLRHG